MKIIIIGTNETVFLLAKRLCLENNDIIIIGNSLDELEYIRDNLDVAVIYGYGSDLEILKKAEIDKTDFLIALSYIDEINIVSCTIAKHFDVRLKIALINNISIYNSLKTNVSNIDNNMEMASELGIDIMINTPKEISTKILDLLDSPKSFEKIHFQKTDFYIEGFEIYSHSEICNMHVKDIRSIKILSNILILVIIRNGKFLFPKGDMQILDKDKIYMIGNYSNLNEVNKFFLGKSRFSSKKIFIIGITDEVDILCYTLLKSHSSIIKIFDNDLDKCIDLRRKYSDYNGIEVVHGNYMDINFLLHEGLQDADIFLSFLLNDENNLLLTMLVKEQNVLIKTITRIEKLDYLPFSNRMGIDASINSKILVLSKIMKSLKRYSTFLPLYSFGDSNSEIFSFEIISTNIYLNKPIKNLKLPKNVLIVGIIRNKISIIPNGDDILKLGDWIIIFSHLNSINELNHIFFTDTV